MMGTRDRDLKNLLKFVFIKRHVVSRVRDMYSKREREFILISFKEGGTWLSGRAGVM